MRQCFVQLRDIAMSGYDEDAGEEVKVFVLVFEDMIVLLTVIKSEYKYVFYQVDFCLS